MNNEQIIEYRKILPSEKQRIIDICKVSNNSDIKQFPNYWTRFKNWDKSPPRVLVVNKEIVGFTGAVFQTRGEYINMYSICVLANHSRKGYGKKILDFLIKEGKMLGKKKIKFSANKSKDGYKFFSGLGFIPLSEDKKQASYDMDIQEINNIEELINKYKAI